MDRRVPIPDSWHPPASDLVRTFTVSRDKNFAAKAEDVVGLYLNPPDKAPACALTRRAKSKRSTAPSRDCQ
jgi:hypothetical protein